MESTSSVVSRSQCPCCNDSSRDNLVLYDDGHSHCFACGLTINGKRPKITTESTEETLPMFTLDAVLGKRNIIPEVIKDYQVKMKTIDDSQLVISFPMADVNKAFYNEHFRYVDTTTGNLTRQMFFRKGVRLRLPLVGWHLYRNQKTIVVCEGETDALALASRLYGRKDVLVLAMVGSTNAERVAAHIVNYCLNSRVVLAFDNDDAGTKSVEVVAQYLDNHEVDTTVYRLDIPKEYKDVGDWIAGAEANYNWMRAIEESQPVMAGGLLNNEGIANSIADYLSALQQDSFINLSFSPRLTEAVRIMPGALVGVVGDSGQGKSTFAEHVMMEALQQKKRVFCVSQEMYPAEVALKLARMIRNEPLDNPNFMKLQPPEYIVEIENLVRKLTTLMNMTDSFGELSVEKIDNLIHRLTSQGLHPDVVVVDHLLAIAPSLEANALIDTTKRLKEIARSHRCCVVLLCHVRKSQNNSKVYRPQMSDVYGSQGLQINANVIVAVASDKAKKETYVETIKVDRLGGFYADVTLGYTDYCLHEVEDVGMNSYDTDETEYTEDESDDVY